MKKILVVEDDRRISDLVCKYLNAEKYHYRQVYTGTDAVAMFKEFKPDLIILDVMLPQMNGMAVCEHIRISSDIPIVFLTARVNEIDRLNGFEKGADDYICKPFNPKELMARIKAILRRVEQPLLPKRDLTLGPICLIKEERRVLINDDDIPLTQIEFNLLYTFMSHPNQVFSRDELLTASQGLHAESYERTIDFHIKNLRRKLNILEGMNYIKTVYGVGYKFSS